MITVEVNGAATTVEPGTTLAALLDGHGVPGRGVAVAVDGEIVPRTSWPASVPSDGARIEVLTAVQGG